MKIYFYCIQYKVKFNTYSCMDQYNTLELAEKALNDRKKNKKDFEEYKYFTGLICEDIEKAYTYKGFTIYKKEKNDFRIFKNEDGKKIYRTWSYTLKAAKEYINNLLLSDLLLNFSKGKRQYNNYSVSSLIMEKTFNHGNGSLALFKLLPEEKKIKVNSSLATKKDIERIKDFNSKYGLNYDLFFYNYSYPEYYNHSF